MARSRRLIFLAGVLLVGSVAGCDRDRQEDASRATTTSLTDGITGAALPVADVQALEVRLTARPRGGSARVGVWAAPDPAAPTLGGAAVRALVLPQLFVARPDGRWSAALVAPRTDQLAEDRMSASFKLREGAVWSDGTPIGLEDLRRSADPRFVASVEASADAAPIYTVRFTQQLPGWRRLWSGSDSIAAPAVGVWGGPFVVASQTPGLETVLRRNDRWWGSAGPFLDEIVLVLVPDPTTARQLLGRGELDAVMPPAGTVRTRQLEAIDRVSVDRVARGGWSVVLRANPERLSVEDRAALFATVDRRAFAGTLLAGEATVLQGFAGPEDATWSSVGVGDAGALKGDVVDLAGTLEDPMTGLLHRSMQKRAKSAGGTIELRSAEFDRVEGWVRDGSYGAVVMPMLDPLGGCWRCRWESVDGLRAAAADAGDTSAISSLQTKLRDESIVLPLWRSDTVVAWRDGLNGVKANGYAASAAWNAWEWWRP